MADARIPHSDESGLVRCVRCGRRVPTKTNPTTAGCTDGATHVWINAINVARYQGGEFQNIPPATLRMMRAHQDLIDELT